MAKITFTTQDFARMQPPQKGMHMFEVIGTSTKASNDKESINFYFSLKVVESGVDDLNIDRVIESNYNSKAPSFMMSFLSAAWDLTIDEAITKLKSEENSFDTDDLIGCVVWGECIDEQYQGRMIRKVGENWAAGSSNPNF